MRFGRLVLRIGDDCSLRRRTNASFVQCSANFITCTGPAQSASSSTSKSASSSYVSSFDKRPAAHSRGQSAVPPIHEARVLPCSAPQCEWLGSDRTVKHAAAAATILLWRGNFLRRSIARLFALLRRLVPRRAHSRPQPQDRHRTDTTDAETRPARRLQKTWLGAPLGRGRASIVLSRTLRRLLLPALRRRIAAAVVAPSGRRVALATVSLKAISCT
eukprot:COSAG04_NODE_139_length_23663_cov_6.466893_3_plen_217_part_00